MKKICGLKLKIKKNNKMENIKIYLFVIIPYTFQKVIYLEKYIHIIYEYFCKKNST